MRDSIDGAGQAGASDDSGGVVLQFPLVNYAYGVADVERINPFDFYELSKQLKAVAAYQGDVDGFNCFFDVMTASRALGALIAGKPIQLGVSKASAETLKKFLDKDILEDEIFEDGPQGRKFKEGAKVDNWTWNGYRRALATFETVFTEEMRETAAYYVPRRGIYWTPALVDTAEEAFPKDIRGQLPEKTVTDWRAAGRCLAFNLLSASGFHVARAVEGTIETYYQLFAGLPGVMLKGWNDYIVELEKLNASGQTPSPSSKTLAELRQMKDDYRNPIMHPRVVLTEPEARILFANGESLIMAMGQEIAEARKGVQPQFASIATVPPPTGIAVAAPNAIGGP